MSPFPDDPPRRHYWEFAHRALPLIVRRNPEPFRSAALAGLADTGLQRLWEDVATRAGAATDASRLITAKLHDCAGRAVVIITPPKPEHTTEVHYIAIVLDRVDPKFLRYVVLEHSWDVDGAPRTALGEWTSDGSHINYGDGPIPGEDSFLSTICDKFHD